MVRLLLHFGRISELISDMNELYEIVVKGSMVYKQVRHRHTREVYKNLK